MPDQRIVVLAGPGAPTHILVHYLRSRFPLAGVIMEAPQDKWRLMRRRAQRIGWMRTAGQVLFLLSAVPLLKRASRKRRAAILRSYGLNEQELPETELTRVGSVNSDETIAAVLALRPDVVHLIGAEGSQISSLFELRFARIAALSGAIGAAAAALLGAALRMVGGGEGITPALPIAWIDLLAVLPCPILAALVAALAARITARRLIKEL